MQALCQIYPKELLNKILQRQITHRQFFFPSHPDMRYFASALAVTTPESEADPWQAVRIR